MQWNAERFAGFSDVEPWLPLAKDYLNVNAEAEGADPRSLLSLYRRLIALRRSSAALTEGAYRPVTVTDDVLAYERVAGGRRVLIALNFAAFPVVLPLPAGVRNGTVLVSSAGREGESLSDSVALLGHEGAVIALAA